MESRTLRRYFQSSNRIGTPKTVLRSFEHQNQRIAIVLRCFYVFPIYWYITHLGNLLPLLSQTGSDLLWPVAWLAYFSPLVGASIVLTLGLLASCLAVFLPQWQIVRVAVFLGLLQTLSLQYSFGKIHHLMHGWLYTTFIFAFFLPNAAFEPARATRDQRVGSIFVFSSAQVMLCLTYSLAGVGKILGTVYQVWLGEITPLHPTALARHIADRVLQTQSQDSSLLAAWMIDNSVLLWPLMLATLYLQFFAVWAAFRPRLHRFWGFGLICFHVMTILSMTIDFTPNVLLLGCLMVASPSAPDAFNPRDILFDLPVIGAWIQKLWPRSIFA